MTNTWLITTRSGSQYLLDLGERPMSTRFGGWDASHLRRDSDAVPLLGLASVEVGQPMVLLLDIRGDGIVTRRTTTPESR